jgi:LPS O-antigen subunit length determinant protein (WzzB/FepE family)
MALQKREQSPEVKENILGVLETLFKWKKEIIYTCVAAAVLSIIVALLLPVYYKSSTTFYAASTDLASPERIFGEANDAMEYYGEAEDIDRVITIAESNEVTDFMINKFNLYDRYDIDSSDLEAPYYVRLKFADMYKLKQTKYDAIVLSVEDKDPEVAAEMATTARNKTSEILSRLIKESQNEVLNTYRGSISEGEKNVVIVNDSLQRTRDRFKVYNTQSQSAGISRAMQQARGKLLINEIELEEMKKQGRINRDTLVRRNSIIAATKYQIKELEKDLELFNSGMAQVTYLETLQEEASEQLSEDKERFAKYLAAYNSSFPTIHIVENARVPLIKSRPIRWLIVVASTVIAFIMAVLGVLVLDQYSDVNWKKIVNAKK